MTSVQTCLHLDQPRHKFIIINIDFPDDGQIQILKDKPYLARYESLQKYEYMSNYSNAHLKTNLILVKRVSRF